MRFNDSFAVSSSVSRFQFVLVSLVLVALATMPGCKNGGGSAELDEGLFSERSVGENADSHWVGELTTGAGSINIVFFEDETGQLVFPGGFAPGAGDGVAGRTFYDLSWEAAEDDEVTVSVDGTDYEFDLRNIDVAGDDQTFTARYRDGDVSEGFDFTRQPGAI